MKQNDQKGPIVVHLDKREWAAVQKEFRESECGGNLPIGWLLWRIYAVDIPGYYKPVLIKKVGLRRDQMSRVVRKPAFCICENKDADQLRGDREADQRLRFRCTDSTIPLLPKSEISSL